MYTPTLGGTSLQLDNGQDVTLYVNLSRSINWSIFCNSPNVNHLSLHIPGIMLFIIHPPY